MSKITVGDTVRFTCAVLAWARHDQRTAAMRGTVTAIRGPVASVDCDDAHSVSDGRQLRHIPLADLERLPP